MSYNFARLWCPLTSDTYITQTFPLNFTLKRKIVFCIWISMTFKPSKLAHLQIKSGLLDIKSLKCTYCRWADKTLYLKNVKCSGEPKYMAALKPKYSFGKWWKWKISLMGIVHKSCMSSQSPVNLFVRNHQFS